MQDIISVIRNLRQTCLVLGVREASRVLTNYTNDQLRPVDLNVAQVGLLAVFSLHPAKTMSATAEALMLDESTLTRNLVVLQRRGLVASAGGRGRGGKQVTLTPEGHAALERGVAIWADVNHALAAKLSKRDLEAGRRFLSALIESVERETAGDAPEPTAKTRRAAKPEPVPAPRRATTLAARRRGSAKRASSLK